MTDKDFFKIIKRESKKYNDDITEGFPYFCLKIFFDNLSNDDIENAIYDLDRNDESIDAFFINDENTEINFIQFKSAISLENIKPVKKEWLSYLYDIPNKLNNSSYIDKHTNERVKDIAADYVCYQDQYTTKFYFFHLGYNPNTEIIESYKNFYYFNFYDIKEEFLEFESKQSLTEPESITIKLSYEKLVLRDCGCWRFNFRIA